MTKIEKFNALYNFVTGDITEEMELQKEELLDFIDTEISRIKTSAERSKARRAEKNAELDDLRNAIYGVLTDEPKGIDSILNEITIESTAGKVSSRLSALVREGLVAKESIKVENRKVMGYKLA